MKFDLSHIDPMHVILAIGLLLLFVSFWRAHRKHGIAFDAFDLIMVDGKVDRIAMAFMLVLAVTTWIVIDLQITGRLSEGYFTTYGLMWVGPLVARVVFNKTDMPAGTMTSTKTTMESIEKVSP